MKHAKKIFNILLDIMILFFGLDCKDRRDAVDAGLLDFSGQGRNKYGI